MLDELLFVDKARRVHQKVNAELFLVAFDVANINLENVLEAKLAGVRLQVLVLARAHGLVDEILKLLVVQRALPAHAVRPIQPQLVHVDARLPQELDELFFLLDPILEILPFLIHPGHATSTQIIQLIFVILVAPGVLSADVDFVFD